jgi:hypothetical protein
MKKIDVRKIVEDVVKNDKMFDHQNREEIKRLSVIAKELISQDRVDTSIAGIIMFHQFTGEILMSIVKLYQICMAVRHYPDINFIREVKETNILDELDCIHIMNTARDVLKENYKYIDDYKNQLLHSILELKDKDIKEKAQVIQFKSEEIFECVEAILRDYREYSKNKKSDRLWS